jgi:multicomponent Na+:H+ antiporter subunit D
MALAGVPPMNGFISKVALVRGGIDAGQWVTLGLAIGAGIITLMYMTRTWSLVFQQKPNDRTVALKGPGEGDSALAPLLLIAICVALGLYAAPLIELAQVTVEQLGDPTIYINAVLNTGGATP